MTVRDIIEALHEYPLDYTVVLEVRGKITPCQIESVGWQVGKGRRVVTLGVAPQTEAAEQGTPAGD